MADHRSYFDGTYILIILIQKLFSQIDDIIVCVSGKSSTISKPLISIIIDSVETSFTQKQLSVLADPQVHNIYLNGSNIPLRSTIVSGGLDYSLRGRNLGATLTQTLVFVQGGTEISRSVRLISE